MIRPTAAHSLIVRYIGRRSIPFIQLYALYVLGHGDDGPGGGFQAGVIFAAAFILLGLADGWSRGRDACPQSVSDALLPTGALIYAGIGVGAVVAGGAFLQYGAYAPDAGAAAHEFGLMGIEIGVMITVAASMTTIFFEMARPEIYGDREPEPGPGREPGPGPESGPESGPGEDS
ncbi:MAG: MnhB domain-containing protein [Planctomycetota bacterium]